MNKTIRVLLLASLLIGSFERCSAGFIIGGDHQLMSNQANQIVDILASPSLVGELANGLNFNVVIGDGGSVVGGIDNNTPKITGINLKPTNGLFNGLPDIQTNVYSSPKLFQSTIAASNLATRPTITSNVLLAQITFDTTGFTFGTWKLGLDGFPSVGLPSSDFAGAATTVFNGNISIAAVPEPSSFCLLLLVCLLTWILRHPFTFRRRFR